MRVLFVVVISIVLNSHVFADPIDQSKLPPPYDTANLMPYKPDGWYHNNSHLAFLISTYKVVTVVEVGCWMGASTLNIASMLPEHGKLYAVDTWNGSPNESHDPKILATLYDQFLSNVIHAQLTHKIIPIRMDSVLAAEYLDVMPDLIYIDATHTYEACYADLQAWYPHVKGHGILCGDDWLWGDDLGLQRAVIQFAQENNLTLHVRCNWFWWLEEN